MFFTIVLVVALVATVTVVARRRASGRSDVGKNGWMSERWLVEHRATRSNPPG